MKDYSKILVMGFSALLFSCTSQVEKEVASSMQEHEVIQLYEGAAPGSEDWDWDETIYHGENEAYDGMTADVTHPTITVYRPEKPNGAAIIVCPGGAFYFLCMDREGEYFSKLCNEHGITCFVLKYRLGHAADKDKFLRDIYSGAVSLDDLTREVIPMAIQDAATAIRYVRSHASEYGIDPGKIGISGSSAGGCVTMGTSLCVTDDASRPNFAVATYPYFSPHIRREAPSEYPLPLFIAVARDDSQVPVAHSMEFCRMWLEKGQKVELHLYQEGEHGFVGTKQGLEVDTWTDNLFLWLKDIGVSTD